jgi:ribosomal protein L25 (general stress protein Ctc)
MNITGQIVNINQNMHIPAHIVAEKIASDKFADEFAKIAAKEKEDKVEEVREIEEIYKADDNLAKDEQRELAKEEVRHIDIKG